MLSVDPRGITIAVYHVLLCLIRVYSQQSTHRMCNFFYFCEWDTYSFLTNSFFSTRRPSFEKSHHHPYLFTSGVAHLCTLHSVVVLVLKHARQSWIASCLTRHHGSTFFKNHRKKIIQLVRAGWGSLLGYIWTPQLVATCYNGESSMPPHLILFWRKLFPTSKNASRF